MPGPGGGGGGGRGGGFGGGGGGFRGGGGFHGGGHHHHHHPHHHHYHYRPFFGGWGWGWGPRFYGGGFLFGPIFLILFLLIYLFGALTTGVDVQTTDPNGLVRDEMVFQGYVDDLYARYFSDTEDYEDHMVMVVLTYEDCYYYDYVVWCGDDIEPKIYNMMGIRGALDTVMNGTINETNYKYSLDSDLAQVMRTMADKVAALGLEDSYTCDTVHGAATAEFVNNTELPMTVTTVEKALNYFAETTGISLVLVVEDAADVYQKQETGTGINVGRVLAVILLVVLVIVIIVIARKKRKQDPDDPAEYRKDRYRD